MTVLPDVLAPGLRIVFCGTAAGAESARQRAYYAGPGNRFWPTLHEVGLTPERLAPAQYASILPYGLGLTDLAKHVAGADAVLRAAHFDVEGLCEKVLRFQPRFLAFTSKRAAGEFLGRDVAYGLQPEVIGETRLFVLPSPSGAARGYWAVEPWRELARLAGG